MKTPLTSSLTAETAATVVDFLSAIEPSPSAPATTKKVAAPKNAYSEIREKVRNIKGGRGGGQGPSPPTSSPRPRARSGCAPATGRTEPT